MPTTANGWPYPADTQTPDVPRDLKALADTLDDKVFRALDARTLSISVNPAAVIGTLAVTFPVGMFSATPVVVCAPSGTTNWIATTAAGASTGFTAQVRQVDGTAATGTVGFHYIAVQL